MIALIGSAALLMRFQNVSDLRVEVASFTSQVHEMRAQMASVQQGFLNIELGLTQHELDYERLRRIRIGLANLLDSLDGGAVHFQKAPGA